MWCTQGVHTWTPAFLLYVNDLGITSDVILTVMFADDTSMFINGTDAAAISTKFNNELMNVATWI